MTEAATVTKPAIQAQSISHGTLGCKDIDRTRQFYEEFLGLNGVQTSPVEQHGTYSFMFWDMDDNCWEILSNPARGYMWIFDQGDLEGKGHFERGFHKKRPDQADTEQAG